MFGQSINQRAATFYQNRRPRIKRRLGIPPEGGTFFRFQVYKGQKFVLVEVCEREGKSVILVRKTTQRIL